MESEEILGKIPPQFKKFILPIVLGLIGTGFLGFGAISMFQTKPENKTVIFESGVDENEVLSASDKEEEDIVIDISGAVNRPGVYSLKKSSRVKDVIFEAGGLSETASNEYVAKKLNLAAKLVDGMKVYIPYQDEDVNTDSTLGSNHGSQGAININTASVEVLDSLPGVGKVTSEKIVDSRPFGDIKELLDKKVVGKSVFEKIKDKIVVN